MQIIIPDGKEISSFQCIAYAIGSDAVLLQAVVPFINEILINIHGRLGQLTESRSDQVFTQRKAIIFYLLNAITSFYISPIGTHNIVFKDWCIRPHLINLASRSFSFFKSPS